VGETDRFATVAPDVPHLREREVARHWALPRGQSRTGPPSARWSTGIVAAGKDPSQAKQDRKRKDNERRGLTFESQATANFDKTKKEGRADTTLAKTEWLLDMAIADYGAKPMSEITSPMVLRCLRKLEVKGNYETAKRLRSK
jgi:hypothetical protein